MNVSDSKQAMKAPLKNDSSLPSPKQCTASLAAVTDALYVIGGKWRIPIIIGLSEGKRRFNELQRAVEGISAKMLSNELKALEINGFIKKCSLPETPDIIEYELTGYSDTLQDILGALSSWGVSHREFIRHNK